MNTKLKQILAYIAKQNGMSMAFRQYEDGSWEAFIKTIRLHPIWHGTLADMWRIANGRI